MRCQRPRQKRGLQLSELAAHVLLLLAAIHPLQATKHPYQWQLPTPCQQQPKPCQHPMLFHPTREPPTPLSLK